MDGAAEATESGARAVAARPKQLDLNHESAFQCRTIPAAMGGVSSGLELPSDSPNQKYGTCTCRTFWFQDIIKVRRLANSV